MGIMQTHKILSSCVVLPKHNSESKLMVDLDINLTCKYSMLYDKVNTYKSNSHE